MNFSIRQGKSHRTDDIQLVIDRTGLMELTVRAGTFNLDGTSYEFTEDQVCEITGSPTEKMWANGFVAVDKATQDLVMLTDEFTYGVVEEVYTWGDGPYDNLHHLFGLEIPAGTTDLTGLPCDVQHIIVVSPPAPPGGD
jgi:hypothetical protein